MATPSIFHTKEAHIDKANIGSHIESLKRNLNKNTFGDRNSKATLNMISLKETSLV
jgi:hypothetical protein